MDAELKRIIKKIQKLYRLAANAGSGEEAQNAAMHTPARCWRNTT